MIISIIFNIIFSLLLILLLVFLYTQSKPNIERKIDAREIAKLSLGDTYTKNKKQYDCYIDKASDSQYLGPLLSTFCIASKMTKNDKLNSLCNKYTGSLENIYNECKSK